MVYSSDVFADKAHVAPRLSLVNIAALNKVLRFEIFVSKDGQLRAVHLVLDFEPLSNAFQDVGQAIRAGDSRINRIDVSSPGFLAREYLPLVELLIQCSPRVVATLREETTSSRLALEVEIDQFYLEEDKEERANPIIQLPNSEDELNRQSAAQSPRLIIAHVDPSSEEEEEMDINPRKGLKGLLAARNKGGSSKDVPKSQVPANLPLPPLLPMTSVGLLPYLDLKKKRKV